MLLLCPLRVCPLREERRARSTGLFEAQGLIRTTTFRVSYLLSANHKHCALQGEERGVESSSVEDTFAELETHHPMFLYLSA